MKSATSYFKVSAAVIKDDFRRFWAIPVIGFVYYFFSSIFYILMQMQDKGTGGHADDVLASFVSNLLDGGYVFNVINIVWMSVLSVLLVFRYLHNSGHVVAVHSQPFTRAMLLNSHTISCILFIALPILLTGIILMLISQPLYYSNTYYDSADAFVNVFARANILKWMWESFIMGIFVMAVSIAAGMVTGTSFHHAVAALGFNAVLPLCTMLLTMYFETYLFGYVQSSFVFDIIEHMSPVLNITQSGYLTAWENMLYMALVVIIYAFTVFLYYRRKLERATDGIVFKAVDVLVTLVFGYIGMTALGLTFYSMFYKSKGATTFGYIAGALLGIVIVRMIIMKTVKVFNKKTVMILGAYFIIALAFFACLNFDITGYESRIEDDADAIDVSFSPSDEILLFRNGTYDESDAKKAVIALHKMIIENKSLINNVNSANTNIDYNEEFENTIYVSFNYEKENGDGTGNKCIESRSYNVPAYLILNSDAMEQLIAVDESTENVLLNIPDSSNTQYINIHAGMYNGSSPYGYAQAENENSEDIICSEKSAIDGLIAALEKDAREVTYDEIRASYNMPALAVLEISYIVEEQKNGKQPLIDQEMEYGITAEDNSKASQSSYVNTQYENIKVTAAYKNTIEWLNANGYGSMLQYDESYWDFAIVCDVENGVKSADIETYYSSVPESSEGMQVVTDRSVIKNMYEKSFSHAIVGAIGEMSTSQKNIYSVKFYHRPSNMDDYFDEFDAYLYGKDYDTVKKV